MMGRLTTMAAPPPRMYSQLIRAVNTTAMNKCQEGEFDVKPVLLVSHDLLLIAANTLDAIKDYVPHLTLKDEKKSNHEKYTLPPIY